jgi:hypothetical protein
MRSPVAFVLIAASSLFASDSRIALSIDTSEADAVLHVLEVCETKLTITEEDWQKIFNTEPYKRLKEREAAMHREFTDNDFKKFVISDETRKRRTIFSKTLAEWKKADLKASAKRVLEYLPANAVIHAKVFPVIKPRTNSFVWEPKTDATIFLYLDPEKPTADVENMVAHELHHIGFASVEAESGKKLDGLSPEVKTTVQWMGGFGEGLAMLAAAGSPDVHPHANSKTEDRARWDRDMQNFNADLKKVEKFFFDILDGKLKTEEEQDQVGMQFFGVQGPWYTVGYKMAVMVEKHFGREKLIECMMDNRKLLAMYNDAAIAENAKAGAQLALWSDNLLKRVQ